MSYRKKVPGKLTITKPSGGSPGVDLDRVILRIEDKRSGLLVFEVTVSLKEFGRALFCQAYRPCKVEVNKRAIKRLGLVMEHKTLQLLCGKGKDGTRNYPTAETVKPYEIDGCIADTARYNSHLVRGSYEEPTHDVIFRRWVKRPKKVKPEAKK